MTKMNPEVKAVWLTALRSGEYEQGTGKLSSEGKFCCLGVLCDIAIKQFDIQVETGQGGCSDLDCCTPYTSYDGQSSFPPASVVEWAGLTTEGGDFPNRIYVPESGDYAHALYQANDYGLSFEEIAGIIEEQL